ncbi:hypothetical protein PISL3812_09778 [Talaromyces islandicus]|uniref:Tc1-like transposase DDE domain-containing protein n=1 Tax=Talaromyces islandicus TaxID=28573 RepID=A0A0U1MBL3_TALIS|nr:hypothetical protein PISL3812_09778 [Talaromyces islandicus]
MAPPLADWQHDMIHGMIQGGKKNAEIVKAVKCSERTVFNIRSNLRRYGTTKAPANRGGRPPSITPATLELLCDKLLDKPGLYIDEMVVYLHDVLGILVTESSVQRALARAGWSRKVSRQVAKERNADLRDYYLHRLSEYRSYHLVYIDESGCDRRVGFRRTAWSPIGVTPVQISQFRREQRYQILPAYAQDGIILARVYQGSTDAAAFEDFVKQLLQHCNRYPDPKSVLVMDNASFHRTARLQQLCSEAGVKLEYLPPYSPDLNPIEEMFAELKAFIKKQWSTYENDPRQGFHTFLDWCVRMVGSEKKSAEGHFRHAGIEVEDPPAVESPSSQA